mgnify:FL=1
MPQEGMKLQVRTRHRAPLIDCELHHKQNVITLTLKDEVRALTPCQSAVLYDKDVVMGGGIVV